MTTCKIILTPTTKEPKICHARATTSAFNLKLCHTKSEFKNTIELCLCVLLESHFTKSHIRETKHADSSTGTKKILLIKKNLQENKFFLALQFYTLYEQKFSNLGISFYYFSLRILKILKVWTLDFEILGAKRRFNGVKK